MIDFCTLPPRLSSFRRNPISQNGLLLAPSEQGAEHLLNDRTLCRLLEAPDSRRLTLALRLSESTEPLLRRFYAASTLGFPSLLLCGIRSREELRETLSLCHRCICELCEDGREINGCLPRGILVDDPLSFGSSRFWGCDFICLDLDRLFLKPHGDLKELSAFLKKQTEIEVRLLCRSGFDETAGELCRSYGIREIYLPEESLFAAQSFFEAEEKT